MKTVFIVTDRSFGEDIRGVFDNPMDAFTEMLRNPAHTSYQLFIEEFKVNELYDGLQKFNGKAEVQVLFIEEIYPPSDKTLYFKFFKAQDVLKFQEDLIGKYSKEFSDVMPLVKSFEIFSFYEEQTP